MNAQDKAEARCEICGCEGTEDNQLIDWKFYNNTNKTGCLNCISDDMDAAWRKLGFTEQQIKSFKNKVGNHDE